MHLQRSKVLRRQGNRRGPGISRHEQPKLAQLSNALRNTSADRRRNQGVPVLCRWQLHQKGQGNGGRLQRNLDHLSYGGRVTLRRYPFFMPSRSCLGLISKLEKTSKQTQDFVLHFIVFACLGEREARASGGCLGLISKLEKTSTLKPYQHKVSACFGEGEARADGLHLMVNQARKNKQA